MSGPAATPRLHCPRIAVVPTGSASLSEIIHNERADAGRQTPPSTTDHFCSSRWLRPVLEILERLSCAPEGSIRAPLGAGAMQHTIKDVLFAALA